MALAPDPLRHLTPHQKGMLALYTVAARATEHGHKVRVEHGRRNRLRVNDRHLVEVRSTRVVSDSDGWPFSDYDQPTAPDTTALVLIDRADHDAWTYYLARAGTAAEFLSRKSHAWIDDHGGQRPRNDDSTQTTLFFYELDDAGATRADWDLLLDDPRGDAR